MKYLSFILLLSILTVSDSFIAAPIDSSQSSTKPETPNVDSCHQLYSKIHLDDVVNYEAFQQAMIGYNKINAKKKDIITIIDFSKPSTDERLYVIDIKNEKLLFSSVVAHGKKSGDNYATSFSNRMGSHQSSLGFYITENTYKGRNGYSLILNGLEKNINDRAKARAVVIHGADYADPSKVASAGRLGRSFGCPALPQSINKAVIDVIKGGSLLYIYANNKRYMNQSPILAAI